jgi:MarR family transcriptional regulator, lower aerobic nicotinate degradation pathway regulator
MAMALRAAYLVMHRLSDAALAGDGVTADQFVVLSVLADEDRVTQQALVGVTSSDPNTMRAMLVLLEKRGLVRRERHPADGRARSVVLTAKGRKVYGRLWARSQGVREQLEGLFGADESRRLVEFLRRIAGHGKPSERARGRSQRRLAT